MSQGPGPEKTKADEILAQLSEQRGRLDTIEESLKHASSLLQKPQSPQPQPQSQPLQSFGQYLDQHVLPENGCPTCRQALIDRREKVSKLLGEQKPQTPAPPAPATAPAPEKPKEWSVGNLWGEGKKQ